MSAKVEPKSFPPCHVTVRIRDRIVVFCSSIEGTRPEHTAFGVSKCKMLCLEAWTYNLWTEQWRKDPNWATIEYLPEIEYMCGVPIGSVIYMLSGKVITNDLWKVTQNTDGSFDWDKVCMTKKELPSPRRG